MKSNLTSGAVLRVGVALVVVLGLVGGGLAFFLASGSHGNKATGGETEPDEPRISVKVVKPHFDKSFSMVEKRPAEVLAYYRVPLDSRVPGQIKFIQVDKGSIVRKGQILVEIDVPELEAKVKEQAAEVELTKAQVEQREAAIQSAVAYKKAMATKIGALEAKLRSDRAYLKFREKQNRRYKALFEDRAIDERLVDEQEDRYLAAFEAVNYTEQAVKEAEAQVEEADTKITQAKADKAAAKQKVSVAKADLAHAQATRDFATIRAPFDGEVVDRDRMANRGAIVQSADNRTQQPLLSIQTRNLVTVAVRVPDNFAPYITPDTEVIFETPVLPGVKIHGKVTRYARSMVNREHDHTMPVEIDLWTGSKEEFEKKASDPEFRKGLKKGIADNQDDKGNIIKDDKAVENEEGVLPVVARVEGKPRGGQSTKLLPGTFGQLTLLLRKFDDAYMLPSSAIDIVGGNTYIYVVQDGKAHHQRVKIQVDDGKLVKVERLDDEGNVLGDLTGNEEVIVSNLGELSEGQAVNPALVKDWRSLEHGNNNEKH